jgi:hypothetical protein
MAKLIGILFALAVAGLVTTSADRIVRRFRTVYRSVLPNRGERRAQGNYERAT